MQGQFNTSNDFSGSFYLDYGSSGNNLQSNQDNVAPIDPFIDDDHPVMGWTGQSSSDMSNQAPVGFQDLSAEDGLLSDTMDQSIFSLNTQTPVRFQDLLTEDGLLSSPVSIGGMDESLVKRHPEPTIAPSQNSVNISMGNGQLQNMSFPFQQGSSNALPGNIDLNATRASSGIDTHLNTMVGKGPDDNQNVVANDSSNSDSLVISSGISGYLVEENEGGEGRISNGRRLSCKRRAPEDASGELFVGESSRSTQQADTTPMNNHLDGISSEHLHSGIVLGLAAPYVMRQTSNAFGAISDIHQMQGIVGEAENSHRNIRLRRTINQQDFMTTRGPSNSYAQVPGQPAVLFPFDRVPNTTFFTFPPTSTIGHPTASTDLYVGTPIFPETLHPIQWDTAIRSRDMLSSNAYTINGGEASLLNDNSSRNPRNLMLPHQFQRATSGHMLTNLNSVPETNYSGNMAFGSVNNSISHFHHSVPPPLVVLQTNFVEQNSQRIFDIVNHSESQGQGSYYPWRLGFPVDPRQRNAFARVASARPSLIPIRSGVARLARRQTGIYPELAFRSLVTAQRRNRLVSEVRNALALVRRGGSFQFEDVMVIDRSVLYRVPEEPDLHEDMRLDVDGMSYEELLALEELIGNVSTGLTEDAIQANIKWRKYQTIPMEPSSEDESCCICQEDYADGEDLGKLDCGHDFHFNCIKKWLIRKNNCPICKKTGLAV